MKYIYITLVIALLFSGCADKNAFSRFDMQKKQELSADNLQSSKIKKNDKVDGIVSAIYLNKIYPEIYNTNEYFYIYFYVKNTNNMYNPNSFNGDHLTIKLNGKEPIKVKKLSSKNKFAHLTSIESDWQNYYLVAFKNEKEEKLNLVLENGQSVSQILTYKKDEL